MAISNPYLQDQANAITNQANNNLMNYQLPSLRAGGVAAGGFGGSRMGIAQGNAIGQTNQGITNSLAGMYGNAYAADQQNATQQSINQANIAAQEAISKRNDETNRYGLGNQYNLGLGNLYTTNRTIDQNGIRLGADLTGQANTGLGAGVDNTYNSNVAGQNQQWNPYINASNLISPYTGYGGAQTTTQPGGSPVAGAIGGAIGGGTIYDVLNKLWGKGT
jgi:hypothetical protein